ncbi:MAG TPA: TraX, partial [Halomonas sp.]|nr:TraX [Halomonas sp.]
MVEKSASHSVATETAAPLRPSSHWTGWGQWLALSPMPIDHLTRYVLPGDWDLGWAGSS